MEVDNDSNADYMYLLGMPFWNLTYEKIDALKKQMEERQKEIE